MRLCFYKATSISNLKKTDCKYSKCNVPYRIQRTDFFNPVFQFFSYYNVDQSESSAIEEFILLGNMHHKILKPIAQEDC